jgi:starch phosphorylase
VSAGDLSEQISLAGTEASGTGNMKLALNGALSIMTEDGANLEIRDAVGSENIWTFGNRFEDLQKIRANGYAPRAIYNSNAEIKQSLDMIADGYFSLHERDLFEPVVQSLLDGGDPFMILADYTNYMRAQAEIDVAWADQMGWTKKAVLNVSRMGHFSMDRLFQQYAQQVWNVKPVPLPA